MIMAPGQKMTVPRLKEPGPTAGTALKSLRRRITCTGVQCLGGHAACKAGRLAQARSLLRKLLHSQPSSHHTSAQRYNKASLPGAHTNLAGRTTVHASRWCYGGGWLGFDAVVPPRTINTMEASRRLTNRGCLLCERDAEEAGGKRCETAHEDVNNEDVAGQWNVLLGLVLERQQQGL